MIQPRLTLTPARRGEHRAASPSSRSRASSPQSSQPLAGEEGVQAAFLPISSPFPNFMSRLAHHLPALAVFSKDPPTVAPNQRDLNPEVEDNECI